MTELNEVITKISDTIDDAANIYGDTWDSALVGNPTGNYHAITSDHTNDIVVRTADDSNQSSWLCDYLEAVSPANVRQLLVRIAELEIARTALKDVPAHEATDWQVDEAVARMEGEGDMVLVPRGVLGAASGAIRHPGHEAGVTLGLLRHYSFRKQPTAFERGAKLARDGGGISDIWAACKSDDELEEVERGFHSADPLRTGAKDPE